MTSPPSPAAAARFSSSVSAFRASAPATRAMWSSASGASVTDPGEAALVGDGARDELANVLVPQRPKRQEQRARQERPDDGEGGILGGRGDERDPAVLDRGKEDVLLSLGEAVHLVDEEHGLGLPRRDPALGVLDHLAHVLDARGDRREFHEPAPTGHEVRERRLARAGRPPQQDGGRGARLLDEAAQGAALGQQVILPHHLVDRPRPHAHRDGARCGGAGHAGAVVSHGVEEVHDLTLWARDDAGRRVSFSP